MIPFNKPCVTGKESVAVQQAITSGKLSGNGAFGKKSVHWLEERLDCEKALLTPSCTAALEMTAILTNVGPGDEVSCHLTRLCLQLMPLLYEVPPFVLLMFDQVQ
ncbi:hypothetical protein [Virgibacillus halodenitrificans]|uniref:hypothetical protein n=1 Tax=Virgibacillus halodenitrificans TaxID=1482 RepID=UPI000A99B13D